MNADAAGRGTGLFLDAPNIYRESKELGVSVDPEAIIGMARPLGLLVSATAYLAFKDGVPSDLLARRYNQAGFAVRFVPCTYNTKDIDTTMAVDISEAVYDPVVELLVVVSGDGDFVPAVDLAHRKGKRVAVIAFPGNCNQALRSRADFFIALAKAPERQDESRHSVNQTSVPAVP